MSKHYWGEFTHEGKKVFVINARTWKKIDALYVASSHLQLPPEDLMIFKSWVICGRYPTLDGAKTHHCFPPSFEKNAPKPKAKIKLQVWMIKEREKGEQDDK